MAGAGRCVKRVDGYGGGWCGHLGGFLLLGRAGSLARVLLAGRSGCYAKPSSVREGQGSGRGADWRGRGPGRVPAKTIRFWEDQRLLPPPDRTPAGYRDYGPGVLERLAFIRHAQAAGLTLE